jgi:NADH-quinone oxidoreductase subunit E
MMAKLDADGRQVVSPEMANAVNMLAHPLAGAVAMSALGVGVASHAFGVWMGAVSGMMEASERLFQPFFKDFAGSNESFTGKPKIPAAKARASAKTLIADAQSFAREVSETTTGAEAAAQGRKTHAAERLPTVDASADLMPEDFRQPKATARPEAPDDLKVISGIGPKLEKVLNGLGIWTYAQIAGWTAEEIAWVDDYLGFKGRIGRDDWLAQAAALARNETKH